MPPKIPRQRKAYKDLNKRLNKYVLLVEDLFEQYNLQLANAAVQSGHTDGVFSFSRYPALKARVDKIFDNWRQDFSAIVYRGTSEEWKNSNAMQDMLADGMMKWYWGTIHGKRQRKYYMANNDALKAFQTRVSGGMNLSKRVWRLSNTYRAAIEDILSLGIEHGTSAVTLSKRLSKYLNDFPSMRAAYGKKYGRASKAKDCEYQSIRLARSEINMAYRTAEQKRWQQADFIVGYEIRLSAVHHERMPHGDICDILAGRYPKSFIWTGWHPNDLCYVTPIMKTEEEFFGDSETSVNEVTDVPEAFKEWVRNNEDRILAARERGTEAYFLRDNKELVDGILSGKNTANVQLDPVQHQIDALMP